MKQKHAIFTGSGVVHGFNQPSSVIRAVMASAAIDGADEVERMMKGTIGWIDHQNRDAYDNTATFWCPVMLCNGVWSYRPWAIAAVNYVSRGSVKLADIQPEQWVDSAARVEEFLATASAPPDVMAVLNEMSRTLSLMMRCSYEENAFAFTMRQQMVAQLYAGSVNMDPKRAKKLAPFETKGA